MGVFSGVFNAGELKPITGEELPGVFSYLASDAVRNLILIGFLKLGLTSQTPDGTFYGFWKNGNLQGVGLLGSVAAWSGGVEMAQVIGRKARDSGSKFKLLVGLEREVEVFIKASQDKRCGRTETHLFYVLRRGELNFNAADKISIRPARPEEEYEELFGIHTDAYLELARQPLPEPAISAQRLLRRIEEGTVWIARDGARIIFKADVTSETDDAVLIEGIWTHPDLRGQAIGSNAVSALSAHLLLTYPIICLSFRKDQPRLKTFYERIGFKYYGDYGDYTITRY